MRNTQHVAVFVLSSAIVHVACQPPLPMEREEDRDRADGIIRGTPSTDVDDDAVVLLPMSGSFCTGTLIAPNLVLTARHCVSAAPTGGGECAPFGADLSPSTIGVSLGQRPSSAAAVARGSKLFVSPRSTICGHDIALLLLDKSVPNVKPKKVRLTAPVVGELTTAIGYGRDENQQTSGRKIRRDIRVEAVGPATRTASANGQTVSVQVPANDFMTGESVCHGDSGGPLFDAKGLVLGTTSRGTPLGCVGTPAIFSSNAAHAELIKTAMKAAGHPFEAPATDAGADAAADAGPNGPPSGSPPQDAGSAADASSAEPAPKNDAEPAPGKTDDDSARDERTDPEPSDEADDEEGATTSKRRSTDTNDAPQQPQINVSSGCAASPVLPSLPKSLAPIALTLAALAWMRRRARSRA